MDKGAFMTIRNTVSALLLLSAMGVTALADTVELNPDHPDRYVVVKGDTLWDISSRFLRDPWKWPDVWEVNPQIRNPNLIYPGDVISLTFREGKPVLQVERGPAAPETPAPAAAPEAPPVAPEVAATPPSETNVVKLSPQVRVTALERPIPTVPTDAIEQFLLKAELISPEESSNSGYIVSMEEERLIGGTGNKIYVRNLQQHAGGRFEVVRLGKTYLNPGANKKDILGYEALHVADARVDAYGDPSTLTLEKASRESLIGDRVLPVQDEAAVNYNFLPSAPKQAVEGQIIALFDAVSRVGQYQVVVLNQGQRNGLQPGHVLAIYRAGDTIRDTVSDKGKKVTLPDSRSGVLMVFRVFDRVSYGLVMSANRDVRLYDIVRNP
jgi:LysM repeat protein